jgi:hypothetical protein
MVWGNGIARASSSRSVVAVFSQQFDISYLYGGGSSQCTRSDAEFTSISPIFARLDTCCPHVAHCHCPVAAAPSTQMATPPTAPTIPAALPLSVVVINEIMYDPEFAADTNGESF